MPSAFSVLQGASFAGVKFPVKSIDVSCKQRIKSHYFPYVDGGSTEILGRELYSITMEANFQNTFVKYPSLYPLGLSTLRKRFEDGVASTLVIPTIGTIQAILVDYSHNANESIASGEMVKLVFLEDASKNFLVDKMIDTAVRDLSTASQAFSGEVAKLPSEGLFDQIQSISNFIGSIRDQKDLYGALINAKLQLLVGLCDQADRLVSSLSDPTNDAALQALHDLWAAAQNIADKASGGSGLQLKKYTLPRTMSVPEIAKALYGDSSRGGDILSANILDDPFSVAAGTVIKYVST